MVDVAAARVLQQALAAVEPRVRLGAVLVVDVAAVQGLAVAVEVAAVVPRLCRPLVRRDVEASWWHGTPSLKKRRGVARPDPVPGSMPAELSRPRETWCLQMSLIACLHSKRIRVSRFWTWQPE